jgi:Flp pilus assembly protein TadB
MPRRRETDGETVISVTSAQPGHSEDLDSRIARYAWMMSLRVVCFVAAVITPSPWRWILLVGAVFLPSVAVVFANAQQKRKLAGAAPYDAPPRPQLTDRPGPVVQGEYVSDQQLRDDTEK